MKLRRSAHLMVELDCQPRFDLQSVLSGGDGVVRSARWLARAPHLDQPVPVSLQDMELLEALDPDVDYELEALAARFPSARIESMRQRGLLIGDDDAGAAPRGRDDTLRAVPWWPAAAIAHVHGRWSGVDLQARGERGLSLSSEAMVAGFGAAPDEEYRRRDGDPVLPLGSPVRTDLDDLLQRRHTCRNFDLQACVPNGDFVTLLHRVFGARGTLQLTPGAVAVKKTSPAGGGLHATEAYLLVQRAEGLDPGLYHYLALEHALECLRPLTAEAAAELAHVFVAGQHWFAPAPVMVIMTARFDRLFWKYRNHSKAWRVAQLDAGHLSQTLYLSAADLGLGAFVTCAINDIDIEQALDLDPLREGVVAISGFGPRASTRTTLELDELSPTRASTKSLASTSARCCCGTTPRKTSPTARSPSRSRGSRKRSPRG